MLYYAADISFELFITSDYLYLSNFNEKEWVPKKRGSVHFGGVPVMLGKLTHKAAIFLEVSCLNVGSCRPNVVSISDIARCRYVSEIPVFTLCRCRGRVDLGNPVSQVLAVHPDPL